ncbi:MAG: molybdate ABC transporter permease subunit, partial [Thermoleophilia bacterium]|nr:molybdate ABC transporter permease subunit [Thermoleophilia bacterium]
MRSVGFRLLLWGALTLALLFLTLPVVAIFVDAGPREL